MVGAHGWLLSFSTEYRCEQPGDAEVLERIKYHGGDALENLVHAGRDVTELRRRLLCVAPSPCLGLNT